MLSQGHFELSTISNGSILRRDFGWRKSGYHGQDGMERWLGLGVIASNLRRIALAK